MAFQAGFNKGATFQPVGAGAPVTLNITAWSWEEEVERLIITHTGSGGIQAGIAGIFDSTGTIEANVDAAQLPNSTAGGSIKAGTRGVITFNVGSTSPFSVPILITKVPWKSAVNGLVSYTFEYALDSSQGGITYPS